MFGKIFLKEWKDNLAIVILAVILLAAISLLFLLQKTEASLYLIGVFLLLFLPFCALLIGSSAFHSELKDDAWTYLFSRPARKEILWLAKYSSQLGILAVIFFLLLLAKSSIPGLGRVFQDVNLSERPANLVSLSVYTIVPFLLFTVSFCLSHFTDKSLVVFFLTLFIALALLALFSVHQAFLYTCYLEEGSFVALFLMIAAAFILASLLTFSRADLSQQKRSIVSFTAKVIPFVLLAFIIATVLVGRGNLFSGRHRIDSMCADTSGETCVFSSETQGLVVYDATRDRTKVLASTKEVYLYSLAAGKLVLFKSDDRQKRPAREELRLIDLKDFTQRVIVRFYGQESAFLNRTSLCDPILSPDGRRVAFVAGPADGSGSKKSPALFWMSIDGSNVRSLPLDLEGSTSLWLVFWTSAPDSLFLRQYRPPDFPQAWALKRINLETGAVERISSAKKELVLSWADGLYSKSVLIYAFRDRGQKITSFYLVDSASPEPREILSLPEGTAWHIQREPRTGRLAYATKNGELLVYSPADGTTVKAFDWGRVGWGGRFEWLTDGGLAILERDKKPQNIKFLGPDLSEKKTIALPWPLKGYAQIAPLRDKILVDLGDRGLWRLNIGTGDWKKIY